MLRALALALASLFASAALAGDNLPPLNPEWGEPGSEFFVAMHAAMERYDVLSGNGFPEHHDQLMADAKRHPDWNGERWNLDHAAQFVAEIMHRPAADARNFIVWFHPDAKFMDDERRIFPFCHARNLVPTPGRVCWQPD